jgi:excisionase family DNA binding protein
MLPAEAQARRMMTVEQAADYLSLAPKTLRNMLSAGRGPRSYRLGGRRRFRLADLDSWAERHASDRRR